jgi:hypothetical protein
MTRHYRIFAAAIFGLGLSLANSATSQAGPNIGAATVDAAAPDTLQSVMVARRGFAGGGMARRSTFVGPRGGVARTTTVRRGAVAGGAVVRPGYRGGGVYRGGAVVRRGAWVRPGRFWWPAGGAIAAGAAIGVVAAATATAWAGSPPGPGMCWYYTNPSRRQGFWDVCQ